MPGAIALRLSELSRADLPAAGGKGANLGELFRLGLAVPPGFVVSAGAYAEQVRQWGLAERLRPLLAGFNPRIRVQALVTDVPEWFHQLHCGLAVAAPAMQ